MRVETLIIVLVASLPAVALAGNASAPRRAEPIENSLGMLLVHVPPGQFSMGSPESEAGREKQETQHEVQLTRGLWLGAHEITVGQFRQFVRDANYSTESERDGQGGWGVNAAGSIEKHGKYTWRTPGFEQTDVHPVVLVSWNDAAAFCGWLSQKEKRRYRLPTEAEWEYACRAGTRSAWVHGDDPTGLKKVGNGGHGDAHRFTAPVGSFEPNAFGLHDMHGNVWEWCSDRYVPNSYTPRKEIDPKGPAISSAGGPAAGKARVQRGGGWSSAAKRCRSAARIGRDGSTYRGAYLGFRVVLDPAPPVGGEVQGELLRLIIDREVREGQTRKNLEPPMRSADSVFLRRVYLDLVGMIPTYEETTAFLRDTDEQKREKLIDRLQSDPRHARHQAQVWDVTLLGRRPKHVGHPRNRQRFRDWLSAQFEKNEPYDHLVRKLLTAEEDDSRLFYVVHRGADDLTTSTMRLFLGAQLQCARCHDHPYESWTQRDYYGMTGFFVRTFILEGEKRDDHSSRYFVGEKSTGEVSYSLPAEDGKPGKPGKKSEPVKPKLLGGAEVDEPAVPDGFNEPKRKKGEAPPKPLFSRREKVIDWMTDRENPYLARAAVNRIWARFMGRGLVHPVDDFGEENDPNLPALLDALEREFVARRFDMRWLIREIVNSEAYQASDVGPSTDALPEFYDRARVRPLSVEELIASLHVATGLGIESAVKSVPTNHMLEYLGEPTDGEGAFQGSLSEHLFIHNGDVFRNLCHPRKGNLPETLLESTDSPAAKVERMFLSVLSRKPSPEESERFVGYLSADPKDKKLAAQKMEEAMWVLVSCSEFRFNR